MSNINRNNQPHIDPNMNNNSQVYPYMDQPIQQDLTQNQLNKSLLTVLALYLNNED